MFFKKLNLINSKFLETSFEYHNSIKALKKLNINNIAIFTPYSKKLNDEVLDFFKKENLIFWDIGANIGLYSIYNSLKNKNSLNFNPTFNTETYQVALALVSKGLGITITDKISAESSSHPNIKILELKPDLEFSLEIVYSKSNPLSLINKSFISFLSNFEYHNDI